MKKLILSITVFTLLVFFSFKSYEDTTTIYAEAMIGTWHYFGLVHNGAIKKIDDCDQMDSLTFNPEGTFESLQHATLITIEKDRKTTTNCNALREKGNWSLNRGILTRNSSYANKMNVLELTHKKLVIQKIITSTDQNGQEIIDTYIETYKRS